MPKANSMSDTLKKIAEKRGMMIPHTVTVEKRIQADSAAPDRNTYYNMGPDSPTSKDEGMKKGLDYVPYYYERQWDKSGQNYVMVKKRLIKKA